MQLAVTLNMASVTVSMQAYLHNWPNKNSNFMHMFQECYYSLRNQISISKELCTKTFIKTLLITPRKWNIVQPSKNYIFMNIYQFGSGQDLSLSGFLKIKNTQNNL